MLSFQSQLAKCLAQRLPKLQHAAVFSPRGFPLQFRATTEVQVEPALFSVLRTYAGLELRQKGKVVVLASQLR